MLVLLNESSTVIIMVIGRQPAIHSASVQKLHYLCKLSLVVFGISSCIASESTAPKPITTWMVEDRQVLSLLNPVLAHYVVHMD